jgi:hypothetical protein
MQYIQRCESERETSSEQAVVIVLQGHAE